ncbi:MAG: hypothetical protein FWG90_00835 [Oscillospiraceae bacterium]|nr:hypothetical protein [Oscillospiraceae bacterium]
MIYDITISEKQAAYLSAPADCNMPSGFVITADEICAKLNYQDFVRINSVDKEEPVMIAKINIAKKYSDINEMTADELFKLKAADIKSDVIAEAAELFLNCNEIYGVWLEVIYTNEAPIEGILLYVITELIHMSIIYIRNLPLKKHFLKYKLEPQTESLLSRETGNIQDLLMVLKGIESFETYLNRAKIMPAKPYDTEWLFCLGREYAKYCDIYMNEVRARLIVEIEDKTLEIIKLAGNKNYLQIREIAYDIHNLPEMLRLMKDWRSHMENHSPASFSAGFFGGKLERNIEDLNSGDYSKAARIFCVFAENHPASKLRAAKALSEVLEKFSFDDIVKTESCMRQRTSMEWYINWRKFKIGDFFTRKMSDKERRAVAVFASFNPNGYIRERAVFLMGSMEGTLAFIILRQNDWVLQVRQAAVRAFEARFENLSSGELIAALPYAEKLLRSGMGEIAGVKKLIFQKLSSPEFRFELSAGLSSSNIKVRRMCIQALFNAPEPDIGFIKEHLKREPNLFLRRIIFQKLLPLCPDMSAPALVLLKDKNPQNRLAALEYLYKAGNPDIAAVCLDFLLDKNGSIRNFACKIIAEVNPDFDFQAFYKEKLEENTARAILGLGEVAPKENKELIAGYLSNSRSFIVCSAMISAMRADDDELKNKVIAMLDNFDKSIAKTAYKLAISYSYENYDKTYEIFQNTKYEHSKNFCFKYLLTDRKWNRYIYILKAQTCEFESTRKLAEQSMQIWQRNFNKSFAEPTERQKETIARLLSENSELIPDNISKKILWGEPNWIG